MEMLTKIRLATFIEKRPDQTKGRYQTRYLLEKMEPDVEKLATALSITAERPKLNTTLSVYN